MIPILYESDEIAFASNGLGRLRDCISCTVVEERNSIYECDFEYPVDGYNFDLIQAGRIIAVTHDETGDVQPFDIVSYSKPINGVVTFHCVHISYRQSKMTVSGTNINSLAAALDLLTTASPSNPFTYWTDKSSSAVFTAADGVPRSVRQMLGGIEGSILDCYGGEFEWDVWSVKLWSERGQNRDFTIRYGVNLADYNEDVDYSETYTACIPFWVGNDEQNSQLVVQGNMVKADAIPYDGRSSCVPLDLSNRFQDAPTEQQLEDEAAIILASNKTYLPTQTIEVDFIRLQDGSEYANYKELLYCKLCDSIKVVFPTYNTSGSFKIVKTEYDVLRERFNKMELGTLSISFSEAVSDVSASPSVSDVRMLEISTVAAQAAASAQDAADQANDILDDMQDAAYAAGTTLTQIYQDAADAATAATNAQTAATNAQTAAGNAVTAATNAQTAAGNAVTAAGNALTAAQNAQGSADAALVSLSNVEDVVGVLEWITAHGTMTLTSDVTVNPVHVYFIVDPTGDYVVGGTHYSIVAEPKDADISTYYELSVDESVQNYVATHVVVDTEGLWLIPDSGGNKVLIATGAGSVYTTAGTYIIGKVSGVDTVFAKFTTDGATMNATNNTQIAHLGYGLGNDISGGTSTAPYYTLGGRLSGSAIGNYSVAEGNPFNVASGAYSHAEGVHTTASGAGSHAEGGNAAGSPYGSTASGEGSHAEGNQTYATADSAHSEGISSEANGSASHAQNSGTIANGASQTALGKYNVADTTNAVIIGNGTASNARSNALTVDWSGNVNIASGAKYKINGTNLSASDVGALPISGGTMTSNGQIINGHITNSSTRETTPNLTPTGKRGITALLASSTMTTARPGEGTIIHCEWDTNAGWNSQLFVADNDSGNGKPFVAVRGQASGTWTSWDRLLARSDCADWVTAQSQATTSYGNGYWRWREWNSGKVEIWYHGSLTLNTSESDSNGVKRYSRWFNFPNSYSLYRCTCIVNCMDQGGWYGCGGTRDSSNTVGAEPTRAFQVMGYRIQAQPPTTPTNLNIYICGQKTI